jgi:hypothetical protein
MPNAAGERNDHVDGVEIRDTDDADIKHPDDQEQLEEGPAMSGGGAMPSGSIMNHWQTASPNADATDPDSMPHTKSTPMPGETEIRLSV